MGRSGHMDDEKPKENGQLEAYGDDHKPMETNTSHVTLNKVSISFVDGSNYS